MITIPPYLKKGDTIGIVAPAGFMAFEKMQTCIHTLQEWGYRVVLGATVHSTSDNYFSGTDSERLADFQQLLDDKKVDAILCARGGYGFSRIIDDIRFKKFKKHPKWIIGFSDITVLHCHLLANCGIASLHAPMAAAFNDGEFNNRYIRSLHEALEGQTAAYNSAPNEHNRKGSAKGVLVGGNLTMLAHLVGTDSDLKTKNTILFLEDVGEYLYNIDRMLVQLKRSGKFKNLAGLIVGGFTDCKDTERPFGKDVYDLIADRVAGYDFPVAFGFPVSHERENFALKIGVTYKMEVTDAGTTLQEK